MRNDHQIDNLVGRSTVRESKGGGIKNMKGILKQLQENAHSEATWAFLDDLCMEDQHKIIFYHLEEILIEQV